MNLKNSRKPELETLEDRLVPATALLNSAGQLTVNGTNASETIRVTQNSSYVTVEGVGSFRTSAVRSIVVDAKDGNDTVDMRAVSIAATIFGGNGNDMLIGTQGSDLIQGGNGNDKIFGEGGNDTIYGQAGNDLLYGMGGYDYLIGGDGADFLDDGNRSAQEYFDGGNGLDYNADVVAVNGFSRDDIHQRGTPTCGFLASLSSLTSSGYNFSNWISYKGWDSAGVPQYQVAFMKNGAWTWTTVSFDGQMNSGDTAPSVEGESWVAIMNRAWVKFYGNNGQTHPHAAIYALSGKTASTQWSVSDADYTKITNALNQGKSVVAATNTKAVSSLIGNSQGTHAYTVVATTISGGVKWVQVRNPWGYDGGATTSGNANDGYIWVTMSDFVKSMGYLAIA